MGPKESHKASGAGPEQVIQYRTVACRHCADAPCAKACPAGAIGIDGATGSVLVDQTRCTGCQSCLRACPHGIPRYDSRGKMHKCIQCAPRIAVGYLPACVRICPMGALRFGG